MVTDRQTDGRNCCINIVRCIRLHQKYYASSWQGVPTPLVCLRHCFHPRHACIVSKQLNVLSKFCHHHVAPCNILWPEWPMKLITTTASLSEIPQYCISTTKHMMEILSLTGSHIILVFKRTKLIPKFRRVHYSIKSFLSVVMRCNKSFISFDWCRSAVSAQCCYRQSDVRFRGNWNIITELIMNYTKTKKYSRPWTLAIRRLPRQISRQL